MTERLGRWNSGSPEFKSLLGFPASVRCGLPSCNPLFVSASFTANYDMKEKLRARDRLLEMIMLCKTVSLTRDSVKKNHNNPLATSKQTSFSDDSRVR